MQDILHMKFLNEYGGFIVHAVSNWLDSSGGENGQPRRCGWTVPMGGGVEPPARASEGV